MSTPVAGHADFQEYASWLGTPQVVPTTTFNPGTTVILTANVSNYLALMCAIFEFAGNGTLQYKFFTDASQANLVDVYQWVLAPGNTLCVNVPMQAPFVEVSIIVSAAHTAQLEGVWTPNNIPVLRPTYQGLTRHVDANAQSVAASSTNLAFPQYIISGSTYVFFQPADSTGKLDFAIRTLDTTGAVAYELMKFTAPTGPVNQMLILPPQPTRLEVVNNDGAAAHVCNYSVQMLGN